MEFCREPHPSQGSTRDRIVRISVNLSPSRTFSSSTAPPRFRLQPRYTNGSTTTPSEVGDARLPQQMLAARKFFPLQF
jgi:hypothetical protein